MSTNQTPSPVVGAAPSNPSDALILNYHASLSSSVYASIGDQCDVILSSPFITTPKKSPIPQPAVVTVSATKKKFLRLDGFNSPSERKAIKRKLPVEEGGGAKRKKRVTFSANVELFSVETESLNSMRNEKK